ncbi:MAG: amidohydrolase [Atribacterota bacterium]|nr:amidohydrolase [Atribacterota bacterium]MDD4896735.1 amidohydrolase [Atribacterota bacterium]MDD5637723.1 amidohydrolase [Atribacterota bacterium]
MRRNILGLITVLTVCILIASFTLSVIAQVDIEDAKKTVITWADDNASRISDISYQLWEFAEIGLKEFKSSDLLVSELEQNGFSVERGLAGMPTSFVGTYTHGTGKPVIGILAEYDALPNGHSCGHNLFGAGSVAGAIVLKEAMEKHNIDGTVKLFGTPTEDTHGGKVWMAREGVFDGCDVFLSWHSGTKNESNYGSNLAVQILEVNYKGISSHAGAAPEKGRSALDGLTISSIAMEFLREHMIEPMRIQYIITNGGQAPNSVPEYTQMRLVIRGPMMKDIDELRSREGGVDDCLRAGALASGTDVTMQVVGAFYNKIPNKRGSDLVIENMKYIGAPTFTEEEEQLVKSIAEKHNTPLGKLDSSIHEPIDDTSKASADTGDVSYIAPLISFNATTEALDTPGHSSAKNEQMGTSIGWKGTIFATKVFGCTGLDLLTDETKLTAIQNEFQERMVGVDYHPVIPADLWPPIPKENPSDFKGPAVPVFPEPKVPESLLYWKTK